MEEPSAIATYRPYMQSYTGIQQSLMQWSVNRAFPTYLAAAFSPLVSSLVASQGLLPGPRHMSSTVTACTRPLLGGAYE